MPVLSTPKLVLEPSGRGRTVIDGSRGRGCFCARSFSSFAPASVSGLGWLKIGTSVMYASEDQFSVPNAGRVPISFVSSFDVT